MNAPALNLDVVPGLSMAEYLKLPAVSASLVQTVIDECPRAAWHASWLNPTGVEDHTDYTDNGTIAHAILLEGSQACVACIDPKDYPSKTTGAIPIGWTNNSIKIARDSARVAGKIPILKSDMAEILAMVDAAAVFIDSLRTTEPTIWRAFQPKGGESEITMLWNDGGTQCKMRPDRISTDRTLVVNYKTTSTSVEPDRWGRSQMIGAGYYIGAAWYRRGVKALCGVEPDYVYLCQETAPPYLCSLVGVNPAAFALGEAKCATGLRMWQECVARDHWPAYANRVCYPELPAYESARWEEREVLSFQERLLMGSQA